MYCLGRSDWRGMWVCRPPCSSYPLSTRRALALRTSAAHTQSSPEFSLVERPKFASGAWDHSLPLSQADVQSVDTRAYEIAFEVCWGETGASLFFSEPLHLNASQGYSDTFLVLKTCKIPVELLLRWVRDSRPVIDGCEVCCGGAASHRH